jgi:hypothetical protein
MARLSPKELYDRYRQGFNGCLWEQHIYDRLLEESKYGYFGDGSKRISGSGKGKLSLPYKSVLKFDKNPYNERQVTGDCQNGSDLVLMSDGSSKAIKDIKIGEYVISALGKKRKVTNIFKKPYHKKMVELTLSNHTKIASTPDHQYIIDNISMKTKAIGLLEIGDSVFMPQVDFEEDHIFDMTNFYDGKIIDENTDYKQLRLEPVEKGYIRAKGSMIRIVDINIVEPEENFVYCIEVEKDHNFICNGIGINNCVSHATRNACDISRAVEIDEHSEKESWVARGATEGIYGARGWAGQGMSCSRAAEFVSKIGGILVRKEYKGVVDLTKYNGNLGAGWGGRGLPDKVIDLANDHQIKTVSLIRNIEEARDALANGYGLSVCSSYGFNSTRDKKGFAKVSGSWAHAMAWTACDDTNGELAFLVQNSWGKWNDGGHPEWGPIPDGSFLIHSDVAAGMLAQNGAYAFSNFDGFPVQKLPDYGFDYL